jgi:hypothetical protein
MFVAALAAFAFPSSAQSNGAWEVIHDWDSLPGGLEWGPASQVSASPDGRIIVFRREAPTFVILDADGNLLNSWDDGLFTLAHGIRVDRDGFV